MNEKKVTNEDLANLIGSLSVTTDNNTKAIDVISKTTLKILETMATKEELNIVKSDVSILKSDVSVLKTDQKSFRTETRERFDKLEKNLKENEESIGAIVADYHPHIIKLEEKVFGSSTLSEA